MVSNEPTEPPVVTAELAAAPIVLVPELAVSPAGQAGGIWLWVRDLLVSAIASILIITFLYQPVRVEGTSMLPRLEDRDRLFINKFVYHISSIERGDVVVFH